MQPAPPSRPGPWLDRLQVLVTAGVALAALRGHGNQAAFVAVWLALPLLRGAASPPYRARWRRRLAARRSELEAYAREGGRAPARAALLLVVVPAFLLYLANGSKLSSTDNLPLNLTAASLVLEGNAELSEYTLPGDPERETFVDALPYSIVVTDAGLRSLYPLGNLVFATPVWLVSRLLGGEIELRKPQWRLAKLTAAAVTALSAGLVLLIALQLVDARAALFVAWMYAAGSVALSTLGQGLWSHTGATFLLLGALWIEFRRELPESPSARRPLRADVLQGLLLGSLFATRLTTACFLQPFGLWQLSRAPVRAARVGLIALLAFAPWALYSQAVYGTWLGPQMVMGEGRFGAGGFGAALAGLLVSPGRGLFVYQPWLLLLVAMLFLSGAHTRPSTSARAPRGWAPFCLAAVALQLALVASWGMWWGGHCWGSRLLAESVPLCALLVAPAVARLVRDAKGRRVVACAVAAGFLMQVGSVFGSGSRWMDDPVGERSPIEARLWDWRAPPFLYPLLRPRPPA